MSARWSVKFDAKPVTAMLDDIERRQLPFAHSVALTNTALFARKQVIEEMRRVFDRPRPQTVNEKSGPLRVKTADRKKYPNDYSEVRMKDFARAGSDPALVYLSPAIRGGARIQKRSEYLLEKAGILPPGYFVVPGAGAELDQYGNIKRTQMTKLLAALGAHSSTTKKGKAITGTGKYFAVRSDNLSLPTGVWERLSRTNIRPVLIFVRKAKYRRRIRWEEMALQTGHMRFPIEFHLAMRQAMATARIPANPLVR